jgi:hypothetical protein
MNLKGIISISGKPGLFKVIAQGKNNLIVESLIDKKRFPAYAADRVSALEDISIYTYDEDVALKTIYRAIYDKENGGVAPSHKDKETVLRSYLEEVLPNYDQERVYFSDIKKLFQWYNLLHSSGELKLEEEEVVEDVEVETAENKEVETIQIEETKPKKAPKAKKTEETEASEDQPKAKKTTQKKVDTAE